MYCPGAAMRSKTLKQSLQRQTQPARTQSSWNLLGRCEHLLKLLERAQCDMPNKCLECMIHPTSHPRCATIHAAASTEGRCREACQLAAVILEIRCWMLDQQAQGYGAQQPQATSRILCLDAGGHGER